MCFPAVRSRSTPSKQLLSRKESTTHIDGKQNDASIKLQNRKFCVAQPIKWMNLKDTNLLDRVNEIYAFPAQYAISIAQKERVDTNLNTLNQSEPAMF